MATPSLGFGISPFGTSAFGDPVLVAPGSQPEPLEAEKPVNGLLNYQYEIDGHVFGVDRPLAVEPPLTPGVLSWRSQISNVTGGGRRFGVDEAEGATWTFEMFIDQTDEATALAALGRAARTWRAEHLRNTPGAVTSLRYRLGGRTRRVFGRPGRFAASPENRLMSGYIPVTATFECGDELHYADVAEVRTLSLNPASVGGMVTPFVFPLKTQNTRSTRAGTMYIEGDSPTWVTIGFRGPVSDARVVITGANGKRLVAGLDGHLAYDDAVTIDPSPWTRAATRLDGTTAADRLSRDTVMTRMRLEPGFYEAVYTGSDQTGLSRAAVSWRAAYASL